MRVTDYFLKCCRNTTSFKRDTLAKRAIQETRETHASSGVDNYRLNEIPLFYKAIKELCHLTEVQTKSVCGGVLCAGERAFKRHRQDQDQDAGNSGY